MPLTRHFLDWKAPLAESVCSFLIPDAARRPIDLAPFCVVAPTRQAGRRLRMALALRGSGADTAVLSARVVLPSAVLRADEDAARIAAPAVVQSAWAAVLMSAGAAEFPDALPAAGARPDFDWALGMGELLQRLRSTLADGGWTLASVCARRGGELEERSRWDQMAELERRYLVRLAAMGRLDPCLASIARAENPVLPDGARGIVLAAVPDLSPLAARAFEQLSARVATHVLIHAPPALADHFDEWGRPLPEPWSARPIAIPDPDARIVLASSHAAQARHVVEEMARDSAGLAPGDVAVGVPDSTVTPFVETELAAHGLPAFDPSERPLADHRLSRLVQTFADLAVEASYASFAALLRHPDMLDFLARRHALSPARLLTQLDGFQNTFLPPDFRSIEARLAAQPSLVGRASCPSTLGTGETPIPRPEEDGASASVVSEKAAKARSGPGSSAPDLRAAARVVRFHLDAVESAGALPAVRSFLQAVFAGRPLDRRSAADREFAAVASGLDALLRELADAAALQSPPDPAAALSLLRRRLAQETYDREPRPALVDLEGWMELPWNDAPRLIVTGMNEGVVPGGRLSDAFLPDSLRRSLALRDDRQRLARDSFLMTALIESRRGSGRVSFIVGRTSRDGDPLKPSRLLFRCGDEALPGRARRLFGPVSERRPGSPHTMGFRLDPSPPPDLPPGALEIRRLSATAFRAYLACPFRFYLGHVLGLAALSDEKRGPDALDFGTLMHETLREMGQSDLWRCPDAARLGDELGRQVAARVATRFGRSPPLPITVALESARQRLRAAARVQTQLAGEGWEIVTAETRAEMELSGMTVSGTVDRVDRHCRTGVFRVLDYKTSDAAESPGQAHLAPPAEGAPSFALAKAGDRTRRWVDLQLPLYRLLIAPTLPAGAAVELGYFNLPKAVADTDLSLWEGFSDVLLDSARTCAEGVITGIRNRIFWPPSERPAYDEFASLFPGGPAADHVEGRLVEQLARGDPPA